tara:strand:+ start:3885 stop:4337 length:453 start_codon:yes stop_codon:yes gene_type:complete
MFERAVPPKSPERPPNEPKTGSSTTPFLPAALVVRIVLQQAVFVLRRQIRLVLLLVVMMIRIRSRLSRPGPDKTSSTIIILGRWIHLMMMLVLGIGGLEKRTTPTLLHDEKTKKQPRLLFLDDFYDERTTGDTALLFFGVCGYIERGQRY